MKKKSGGGEGGGANWMDTYGDMVTLLLCFFVLLYSMSTIDQEKYKAIALSFNPNAVSSPTVPDIGSNNGPIQDPELDGNQGVTEPSELEAKQEEYDNMMEQLYEMMKEYIEQSGKNVEITKGDGGIFLSFADSVFFAGDSYELLPDGREMLDALAPMLDQASESIDELKIMGHTAQASASVANTPVGDRMLAAERAAQVTAYLQERISLDAGRIVSEGYGQFRPVAGNDVEENRRKNRRVEMVVTGKDLMNELGDAIEQYNTVRTEGPSKASASSSKDESSSGAEGESSSAGPAESNGENQEG